MITGRHDGEDRRALIAVIAKFEKCGAYSIYPIIQCQAISCYWLCVESVGI